MARSSVLTSMATATVLLAGCAAGPHGDAVRKTARAFASALSAQDGAKACSLLTDNARSSVAGATDESCADAVTGVQESSAHITGVQVWGDAAQVRIGSDVLFLRRTSKGWRVSAAGCTSRPQGPYDCKVGG